MFKTVDSDGNPVYNEKALFAAKLGPKGTAWGETWDKRREDVQKTLANARTTAFQQQEQRNKIAAIQDFRLRKDELSAQLFKASAREDLDIIATAKKTYSDTYNGFIPQQLKDLEARILKENKEEAEQKLLAVQALARDGVLTQGKVLSIEDPTMRAEAQELLIEQNETSRFGRDYQETLKSLANDAKLIAQDSLEGPSGSTALELQLFMENQFAAWYKEGLAQTTTILQLH